MVSLIFSSLQTAADSDEAADEEADEADEWDDEEENESSSFKVLAIDSIILTGIKELDKELDASEAMSMLRFGLKDAGRLSDTFAAFFWKDFSLWLYWKLFECFFFRSWISA